MTAGSEPARAGSFAGARSALPAGQGRGGAGAVFRRRLAVFLAVLRWKPIFALGYAIVLGVTLCAIFAPWLAPFDPVTANPEVYLLPPGLTHWFGTDNTGMDIFSRILYAPRTDLTIAVLGTALSAAIGIPLGAVVGYYERRSPVRSAFSICVMRAADVLQAFPVFVFAIALVAVFSQGILSVVIAIAFVNIPIYLRLMRSQVMAIRTMRYVDAAFVSGASDFAILSRHIMPNAIGAAMAQLSINIGWSVLLTAGLSFVGAGVVAPTPEWGSMIATGFQNVTTGQWWPSVVPGIALGITVFGFALVGSSLEVLTDPAQMRLVVRRDRGA